MKLATPSTRTLLVSSAIGLVLVLLPALFHVEPHHAWDRIPGFFAIFGALGCGVLIVVSKWLGRVLLVRPEGWYAEDATAQPESRARSATHTSQHAPAPRRRRR